MAHTLGTGAKATGKSRTTILRAVQKGKISATKDAHGRWQIEDSELFRVYPAVNDASMRTEQNTQLSTADALNENKALHAALEAEKQQVRELRADRDEWREQAKTLLLAHAPRPPDSRPWWRRLF